MSNITLTIPNDDSVACASWWYRVHITDNNGEQRDE
nr:MAG TPA: hypothetical protein [Caudoviricetes sp.]